jgi:hypothetical protein
MPITNRMGGTLYSLTLISLKPRSSDVKDSLIILKLRAKHIAPFKNLKVSAIKAWIMHQTASYNEHEMHTSSPSPFARKSNVDNVVLYFRQSEINSAPCAPICRICNFAEEARTLKGKPAPYDYIQF